MPLTLLLVAAVLTVAFSLHDRVIMRTVSMYEVMDHAAEYQDAPGFLTSEIAEMLDKRLIAAQEVSVSAEEGEDGLQVGVDAQMDIPLSVIRELTSFEDRLQTKTDVCNLSGRKMLIKYKTICDGLSAITGEPERPSENPEKGSIAE